MKERILEAVKNALELNTIDYTCSQKNCSQWDSLRHLNVVIEIESEFDIELEPEDIAQMKSIEDIERILTEVTNK